MRQKIIEMRQKRANLVNQAREVLERAENAGRELSADEEQQYRTILDDVDKMRAKIEDMERLANAEDEINRRPNDPNRPNPNNGPQPGSNPRASDEYRAAFNRYLTGGINGLNPSDFKALQATDDTLGGYLLTPQQFVTELLKNIDNAVALRQLATTYQIAKAESLGVPTLESDISDADWTSELATGAEDTAMNFGKRELRPNPLAKRIKLSNKLIRQSALDAEGLVRARLAYKFGVSQEKAFMTGNGVGQPLGIFTASSLGISTARDVSNGNTATGVTVDGLIAAKYSLKEAYWGKARWLFHRNAMEQIHKLKDLDGQYLLQPNVQQGAADMILGVQVTSSEYVPNTFTTGQYVGMIGDFSYYWIADALDMGVQRLVELYAESNQVGFIGRLETDGMPVLEEAFARIKLA